MNLQQLKQKTPGELITESYVNLVPTLQGGTHVVGMRQGLLEAIRDFCESRNLLSRGIKLSSEDVEYISNYRFDGIPWSVPSIWFANISLILLLFIYRKKSN